MLSGPGDLWDRVAAERRTVLDEQGREARSVAHRVRIMVGTVTVMAALVGAGIMALASRRGDDAEGSRRGADAGGSRQGVDAVTGCGLSESYGPWVTLIRHFCKTTPISRGRPLPRPRLRPRHYVR